MNSNSDTLSSWKEIASYLKRSVRTVHRWEVEECLPIHRQKHATGVSVYALPQELDAWIERRSDLNTFSETLPKETHLKSAQDGMAKILKPGWTNLGQSFGVRFRSPITLGLIAAFLILSLRLALSHIEIRITAQGQNVAASLRSQK